MGSVAVDEAGAGQPHQRLAPLGDVDVSEPRVDRLTPLGSSSSTNTSFRAHRRAASPFEVLVTFVGPHDRRAYADGPIRRGHDDGSGTGRR